MMKKANYAREKRNELTEVETKFCSNDDIHVKFSFSTSIFRPLSRRRRRRRRRCSRYILTLIASKTFTAAAL